MPRPLSSQAAKIAYAKAYETAKEKAAATLAEEVAAAEDAARLQVEAEARAAAEAEAASGTDAAEDGSKAECGSEGGSEAPQPKKRKVTASGAAPRPPPGVLAPHKFGFGMAVEVAGEDEGYEHSWYSAEVLKVAAKLLVRYDSLFEEDSRRPLTESLDPARLRPVPPNPPNGWLKGATAGQPMELQHDDGWWEVRALHAPSEPLPPQRACPFERNLPRTTLTAPARDFVLAHSQVELVAVADGEDVASATHLTVKGVDGLWDGAEVVVDPALLRPSWQWNGKAQSWATRGADAGKSKPRGGGRGRGRGGRGGRSGGAAGAVQGI